MHKVEILQKTLDAAARRRGGRRYAFPTVDAATTALLVIDMQIYFMAPGMAAEVPMARSIVPNINKLASALRSAGGQVVWVTSTFDEKTSEDWSVMMHELFSREDRAMDGSIRIDPTLGPDAIGILTYANGRFAAQIMKRDRKSTVNFSVSTAGMNNTGAVDGYDAYFGNYSVNEDTGEIVHRLEGALSAENVGMEVSRQLTINGDILVIQLETTSMEGETITRTLTWERVS